MNRPNSQLAALLGGSVLMFAPAASAEQYLQSTPRLPSPRLHAQAGPQPGVLFPNPRVSVDGQPVSPASLGQRVAPVRPTRPRAVAPPVGDMAVSTVDATPTTIDLGTSTRVPRLVLREAPVREVLSLLARSANLNLIFTGAGGDEGGQTVSVDLEDESVEEAFNAVLQLSGLQANRRGRTIFVGSQLPAAARNVISRSYRLNQVTANAAATFLATQGASVQIVEVVEEQVVDPETQRIVRTIQNPPNIRALSAQESEGGGAPLLLRGLTVTADERLNAVTLVGDERAVRVATTLLTQLDARRRQVAVNVKIVDVNLAGLQNFNSSFSFGFDDTFVVSDGGNAAINFGGVNPPAAGDTTIPGNFVPPISALPIPDDVEIEAFFDFQDDAPFGDINRQGAIDPLTDPDLARYARPNFGTRDNPFQPGVSEVVPGERLEFAGPELFELPDRLLATITAQITSGNAKILTDPTLVVQEGQESTVRLTDDVVGSVVTSIDTESGVRTVTPQIEEAGLIVNISIERIDDNGFVSLSVSPVVSSINRFQEFDSGAGADNTIVLLSRRELSSGLIRLRDGQTLILSGIIQENEPATVSKVPILGDLPIVGALFRSTSRHTERDEVVVLLTPEIIDDSLDAGFGYGYTPGPDARQMLQQQGFPVAPPAAAPADAPVVE